MQNFKPIFEYKTKSGKYEKVALIDFVNSKIVIWLGLSKYQTFYDFNPSNLREIKNNEPSLF